MPTKRIERHAGTSKKFRHFEKRYISASELAIRWSVSQSAIYHGGAGSNGLSAIRLGRSVRFILSEVEAFEKNLEAQIRSHKDSA